jgi:hypothetical protein
VTDVDELGPIEYHRTATTITRQEIGSPRRPSQAVTRDKDLRTASLVKRALIYQPVNATAPRRQLVGVADGGSHRSVAPDVAV